jgi:aspartate ammonia-lyase
LAGRCVQGIIAHPERCEALAHRSLALITALAPQIGYLKAAMIAKESLKTGKSIQALVIEHRFLDAKTAKRLLSPSRLSR